MIWQFARKKGAERRYRTVSPCHCGVILLKIHYRISISRSSVVACLLYYYISIKYITNVTTMPAERPEGFYNHDVSTTSEQNPSALSSY
jgi:hypothetical protein